jgi:hypothetical protein
MLQIQERGQPVSMHQVNNLNSQEDMPEDSCLKFLQRRERRTIIILCILAMARIFVFGAAFPFFNNVDEQMHFDTIVKYARGYLPHAGNDYFDYESAKLITTYGTWEYFHSANEFPGGTVLSPLWTAPQEQTSVYIKQGIKMLTGIKNLEAFSPPVYYLLLGAWYNVGRLIKCNGLLLLYWLRFFNVLIYGLLVWCSYLLCKSFFRNNDFLRIAVPLLLVFFPQDLFYTLNCDTLSALFFVLSLLGLSRLTTSERPVAVYYYPLAGIVVASTFLIKLTNIVVYFPLFVYFLLLLRRFHNERRLKEQIPHLALLLLAATVPVAIWIGWNISAIGDATGTADKVLMGKLTVRPVTELFSHPVFTAHGFVNFLRGLLTTFWRGELIWGLKSLSWAITDSFYVFSSLLLIASCMAYLAARRKTLSHIAFFNYSLFFACIAAYVAVLVCLSIRFDFSHYIWHQSSISSFTSGRLIAGAFVPFLCLYAQGIQALCALVSRRISPLVIIGILGVFIMIAEIAIKIVVFKSAYNFYHIF